MNNPDEEQLRENEDENFKSKDAGASKNLFEAIEDRDQYYSEIFDTLM